MTFTWGDRFVSVWALLRSVLSIRTYALWTAPGLHRFGCPSPHCMDQVHIPFLQVAFHRLAETMTDREFAALDTFRAVMRSSNFAPRWGDADAALVFVDLLCAKRDLARRNVLREKLGQDVDLGDGSIRGAYDAESARMELVDCEVCGATQAFDPQTGSRLFPKTWQCADEDECAARSSTVRR